MNTAPSSRGNVYDDYAEWTNSVAKYPPTAEPFYLALGIADEFGELDEADGPENTLKESGDVLWYCARYATKVLGVPFSEIVTSAMTLDFDDHFAATYIGTICGVEKKRIRDGANWDEHKRATKQLAAHNALVRLVRSVATILDEHDYLLSNAIHQNVAKLNGRLEAGTIQGDGDNR